MSPTNFRYLNREGRWLGWHLHNVAVDEAGIASLVPLAAGEPTPSSTTGRPAGPAGVLRQRTGELWYTEPKVASLHRIGPCETEEAEPACDPPDLVEPRGLAPAREDGLVWLADEGLGRVLLLRPDGALVQAIGQPDGTRGPDPDAPPGALSTPWDVEVDERGAVYVLDPGHRRIQKFSPTGQVRAAFWRTVRSSGLLRLPIAIASRAGPRGFELLVLDGESRVILAFDETGHPVDGNGTPFGVDALQDPLAMCVADDVLYVGDNALRGILAFRLEGRQARLVGRVPGYSGPVAGLFAAKTGDVWVHSGEGSPVPLAAASGFAGTGAMWTGPLPAREPRLAWIVVKAALETAGPHSAFRFFVATTRDTVEPPVDPDSPDPFAAAPWRALPTNAAAGFIDADPAPYLWVGIALAGDGRSSPRLSQLRIELNQRSYLTLLPGIYREPVLREESRDDFLLRYLCLVESFLEDYGDQIELLDGLFTADGAPAAALPWLAGLIGLEPGEGWSEARLRSSIAAASRADALRGTAAGLRRALLEVVAGTSPVLDEGTGVGIWIAPSTSCGCDSPDGADRAWRYGEDARLGFTTVLTGVEPYGAVLDVSATLDHAHLIDEGAIFEPAFAEIAHRVTVRFPVQELVVEERAEAIRAVLAREGPAHVSFDLQGIDAGARLGLAVLGQDAILGGSHLPTAIADPRPVLAGPPRGRLGGGMQIGHASTL